MSCCATTCLAHGGLLTYIDLRSKSVIWKENWTWGFIGCRDDTITILGGHGWHVDMLVLVLVLVLILSKALCGGNGKEGQSWFHPSIHLLFSSLTFSSSSSSSPPPPLLSHQFHYYYSGSGSGSGSGSATAMVSLWL
ncbi:hypothetical protein ACJBU6_04352 [Exserohilum turcicum]